MKEKIDLFVSKLSVDKKDIVIALSELTSQISNKAKADIKWNAFCFFKGDRAFVGIMPYRKYVSVIFDHGSELKDDKKALEGSGKNMRHIKLFAMEDIEDKNVKYYIEQSFSL